MNNSGIYQILNKINNKCYIGSSINVAQRWIGHKKSLELQSHRNIHLQFAWNRYGSDNFEFKVLLYCDSENLLFYEQRAIDKFKAANNECGYNVRPIADSNLGIKRSEEYKKKQSQIQSGRIHGPHSEETKRKIGDAHRGKIVTIETKKKISMFNKGRKHSEETKRKMSESAKGKVKSKEHRENLSKALKGMHRASLSEERKKIISNALKGRKRSKEIIEKISKSNTGKKHSEETKKKISTSIKEWYKLNGNTR